MALTKCKSSVKEKRFSNSEVDLWSKEAENPVRYAKRMGANLQEPKQLLSNFLKMLELNLYKSRTWAFKIKAFELFLNRKNGFAQICSL